MADMAIPEFLQNYDEDDILEEMMELVPDEYDKSEGSHYYNFTMPTAVIISQLRGYDIPNAIKLIWPQFCVGYPEYMDYHAELRNLKRKEAQYAIGELTITGTPGTVIPSGYIASTESKNDIASVDYETLEECTIGADGIVIVSARAVEAGADGRTAANTIVVNTSSYDDVTSVNNASAFIGGVDEEDDESLLARIQEYDRAQGDSNVGNPSDYKRWAESVPGTGTANVVRSTDTSGLVTIILTDGNDEPANTTLCESVYNIIMSPDDELARKAPCGATLKVIPPTTTALVIQATVELTAGTTTSITAEFITRLKEYFPTAISNKEVLYHKVCNILGDIEGVYDFTGLTLNGGTVNVPLADGVFPTIDESNITLILVEE